MRRDVMRALDHAVDDTTANDYNDASLHTYHHHPTRIQSSVIDLILRPGPGPSGQLTNYATLTYLNDEILRTELNMCSSLKTMVQSDVHLMALKLSTYIR
jgi:hypothetical protein